MSSIIVVFDFQFGFEIELITKNVCKFLCAMTKIHYYLTFFGDQNDTSVHEDIESIIEMELGNFAYRLNMKIIYK